MQAKGSDFDITYRPDEFNTTLPYCRIGIDLFSKFVLFNLSSTELHTPAVSLASQTCIIESLPRDQVHYELRRAFRARCRALLLLHQLEAKTRTSISAETTKFWHTKRTEEIIFSYDPAPVAEVPSTGSISLLNDPESKAYKEKKDSEMDNFSEIERHPSFQSSNSQYGLKSNPEPQPSIDEFSIYDRFPAHKAQQTASNRFHSDQTEDRIIVPVENQFRFLSLPPEIRTKILQILTRSSTHYQRLGSDEFIRTEMPNYPASLLLTNVQLHNEAKILFYKENIFSITLTRHPSMNLQTFLSPYFRENRRLIKSMRICIIRWGTKDFFQRSFAPLIEDMILRGSLRNLEVLIKDCHLSRRLMTPKLAKVPNVLPEWADPELDFKQRSTKEGDANWKALCRVLRDPDLERVVVRAGPLDLFGDDEEGEEQKKFQDVTRYFRLLPGGSVVA